jgi:hypothetical protein
MLRKLLNAPGWILFLCLMAAGSWYFWVALISVVYVCFEAVGMWWNG